MRAAARRGSLESMRKANALTSGKRHTPSQQGAKDDARRWRAVVARDATFERDFVYAVRTTGIYCRCSCAAKTPRRENVSFFATAAAARAAGYRACKRCHPDGAPPSQQTAALIANACRTITASTEPPVLQHLAREARLSPHHFHRLFKATSGLTPRSYWIAQRAERVRTHLAASPSVTAALYDADFGSARQFYAISKEVLGMTPLKFKKGGAALDITFAAGRCSLGHVLVAATTKGLCAVLLGDKAEPLIADLKRRFPNANINMGNAAFEKTMTSVIAFVDHPQVRCDLPLDIQGTVFQRRVWQALSTIPPGKTKSYGDIATQIGAPAGVRAVAGACAANPLAVLVPCHRVVRSDGALSGYRWGIERKRDLLEREAADAAPASTAEPKSRKPQR